MERKPNQGPSVVKPRNDGDQKPPSDNRRSKGEVETVNEDELQKAMDLINKEDAGLLNRLAQ